MITRRVVISDLVQRMRAPFVAVTKWSCKQLPSQWQLLSESGLLMLHLGLGNDSRYIERRLLPAPRKLIFSCSLLSFRTRPLSAQNPMLPNKHPSVHQEHPKTLSHGQIRRHLQTGVFVGSFEGSFGMALGKSLGGADNNHCIYVYIHINDLS